MKIHKMFLAAFMLALVLVLSVFAQTRVTPTSTINQSESHIAVNPTNPNNIVVVAITIPPLGVINIGAFYTTDGGQSWSGNEDITTENAGAGDPVIAFDGTGIAYCLYQVRTLQQLVLKKSTDGGATWNIQGTISFTNDLDRPWMVISENPDATGVYEIYVTITDINPGTSQNKIKLYKSSNGGTSFTNIYTFGTGTPQLHGSSIALGPNGEVWVAYAEINSSTFGVTTIRVEKSTNGGQTFSQDAAFTVSQIGSRIGTEYYLKNGQIRADSYPRIAVDRSPNPSTSGTVYVTWANKAVLPATDANIRMVKRTPSGTWSTTDVAQGTVDEWAPAIGVGPDGARHMLWYEGVSNSDEIKIHLLSRNAADTQNLVNTFVGVVPAFQINNSYKPFLGDYFGVTGWYEKVFGTWIEARGQVGGHSNAQTYFRQYAYTQQSVPGGYARVDVTQIDESNANFGNLGRWRVNKFVDYAAPFIFVWPVNSTEILRAFQSFKTGTTQKYNLWQNYSNVVNHQSFVIASNQQPLKAQFKTANNSTIRTELIEGGTGGNVEFRDPWLIDNSDSYGSKNRGQAGALWYTKASPFSLNTSDPNYKGVLSNQTVPAGTYYSIRALLSQTINNFTWLFQNWSATGATFQQVGSNPPNYDEKAAIFTTANADVKARYKAHLGTNSTVATAYNNQRKLVYDGTTYHLIYESAGEIYYTSSSDNGVTWSNEVLMSDGNGGCKYPAIDVAPGGIIVVVWQQEFPSTGKVCMRRKTAAAWQTQQQVVSFTASSGFTATPVVTAYPAPYYFIVWHDYGTNNLMIRSYNESNSTFGTATGILSTNSNSLYPTLTADLYTVLHLAWAESNKIYFSKISHSSGGNYSYDVNKEEVTLNYGSYTEHSFPAITTDYNRRPNIVWEAYNTVTYTRNIVHRRRETSGSWSSFTNFSPNDDEYLKPSIGSHFNIGNNNTLEAVWYVLGTNQLKLAKYNGTSWTQFTQTPTGQYPTMSQDMSAVTAKAKMAYRSVSGTPYTLATTSQNLPKISGQSVAHHRRGVLGIGGAELVFELGEFEVGGTEVKLFPYVDTLAIGHTGKWEEMFRTESFPVSNQTNLNFLRSSAVINPARLKNVLPNGAKVAFQLEAVDAPSSQVLAVIDQQDVTNNPAPSSRENKSVVFNLAGNKEIFLRVGISIPTGVTPTQAMVESYIESQADSVAKQIAGKTIEIHLTPKDFSLSQNYPNPFNPTTTITYRIPDDNYVSLKVYDILGTEVATLVEGSQKAGEYRVQFDGKSFGAGIYLGRLRVNYVVKTIKLALVK